MSMTTADLTALRTTQTAALPSTGTLSRAVLTSDGAGGQTAGTPTTSSVACRVAPTTGQLVPVATRLTALTTWTVTFSYNADVQAGDTLTVGTRALRILSVLDGGSWETARRAIAVEVE